MHRNEKGFTLMELMVVIVIVAILAAVAVPLYINYVKDAQRTEARAAIGAIATAEQAYFLRVQSANPGQPATYGSLQDLDTAELLEHRRRQGEVDVHDHGSIEHRLPRAGTYTNSNPPIEVFYDYTQGSGGVFRDTENPQASRRAAVPAEARAPSIAVSLPRRAGRGPGGGDRRHARGGDRHPRARVHLRDRPRLVNRYETARVALAAAQRRLETLSAGPATGSDRSSARTRPAGRTRCGWTGQPWPRSPGRSIATTTRRRHPGRRPRPEAGDGDRDLGRSGSNERITLTRLFPLH